MRPTSSGDVGLDLVRRSPPLQRPSRNPSVDTRHPLKAPQILQSIVRGNATRIVSQWMGNAAMGQTIPCCLVANLAEPHVDARCVDVVTLPLFGNAASCAELTSGSPGHRRHTGSDRARSLWRRGVWHTTATSQKGDPSRAVGRDRRADGRGDRGGLQDSADAGPWRPPTDRRRARVRQGGVQYACPRSHAGQMANSRPH